MTNGDENPAEASPPRAAASDGKPRIQSVARALALLLEVAGTEEGLNVAELSTRLHLTRPTTYHLVHTLGACGFLSRDEHRRYRLGLTTGRLVEAFERQLGAPDHLLPVARSLAMRTGESAYVVGWRDGEIVALAHVPGRHAVKVADFPVGMLGDAHARASGKLLLALAPPSKRSEYIMSHSLQARTANTLTDADSLEREFDKIRAQGYSVDSEEYALGVACLAAPLDQFGVSLSAPKDRFVENFDSYLAALREVTTRRPSH